VGVSEQAAAQAWGQFGINTLSSAVSSVAGAGFGVAADGWTSGIKNTYAQTFTSSIISKSMTWGVEKTLDPLKALAEAGLAYSADPSKSFESHYGDKILSKFNVGEILGDLGGIAIGAGFDVVGEAIKTKYSDFLVKNQHVPAAALWFDGNSKFHGAMNSLIELGTDRMTQYTSAGLYVGTESIDEMLLAQYENREYSMANVLYEAGSKSGVTDWVDRMAGFANTMMKFGGVRNELSYSQALYAEYLEQQELFSQMMHDDHSDSEDNHETHEHAANETSISDTNNNTSEQTSKADQSQSETEEALDNLAEATDTHKESEPSLKEQHPDSLHNLDEGDIAQIQYVMEQDTKIDSLVEAWRDGRITKRQLDDGLDAILNEADNWTPPDGVEVANDGDEEKGIRISSGDGPTVYLVLGKNKVSENVKKAINSSLGYQYVEYDEFEKELDIKKPGWFIQGVRAIAEFMGFKQQKIGLAKLVSDSLGNATLPFDSKKWKGSINVNSGLHGEFGEDDFRLKAGIGGHRGIDIRGFMQYVNNKWQLPTDGQTSVEFQSVEKGGIVQMGYSRVWGNHVIVEHKNGLRTWYVHLSSINQTLLDKLGGLNDDSLVFKPQDVNTKDRLFVKAYDGKVGTYYLKNRNGRNNSIQVKKGYYLGNNGNTGLYSNGDHLHFQISIGDNRHFVDPLYAIEALLDYLP
jgi:murein DD-endopeptidase MepM/ murein hydrolase activator NlpD